MSRRRIYLDNNATTPPAAGVPEAMAAGWSTGWGNPSSAHAEGRRARELREAARADVGAALDAAPEDVVFTSGGSEADALALRGLVESGRVATLVLGSLEHPAVMDTAQWLARSRGTRVTIVEADRTGSIPAGAVAQALAGADQPLVSVMFAQNEIGVVNDVAAIARAAREGGALMHVDAVMAFGKIPVSCREIGADLVSVSAHKIGGPPGMGALVVRPDLKLAAFCAGGKQEQGRRPGTEAFPSILGFGAAARLLADRLARASDIERLRGRLEDAVCAALGDDVRVAGQTAPRRLPNTATFVLRGLIGTDIVAACDAAGLAISAGAACHAVTGASPVMRALGWSAEWHTGLVRVSLGAQTTEQDIDDAARVLIGVVRHLHVKA